jgi:hypothetical protein
MGYAYCLVSLAFFWGDSCIGGGRPDLFSSGVYISWFKQHNTYPGASVEYAWIAGAGASSAFFISPLTSYLCKRLPLRGTSLRLFFIPKYSPSRFLVSSPGELTLSTVNLAIAQTLVALGFILAGFSGKIWQLALTQGLMAGIGVGWVSCLSAYSPTLSPAPTFSALFVIPRTPTHFCFFLSNHRTHCHPCDSNSLALSYVELHGHTTSHLAVVPGPTCTGHGPQFCRCRCGRSDLQFYDTGRPREPRHQDLLHYQWGHYFRRFDSHDLLIQT